jgi:nicotinate-nucleotide pyrophosphorylase (carboxylating)
LRVFPKKELLRFLAEDLGKGDISSALLPRKKIKAVKFAKEIFVLKGCKVRILKKDGAQVKPNQTILEISGTPQAILSCERTALNLLSRMSGIATQTNELVKKIPSLKTKLYATRKTAPGLRFFDKEAVLIGGGEKHRMSLDQMVMLKDNHLSVEPLEKLIKKAKSKHMKIEVEVENQKDAIIAAKAGANIIMLDNFSPKNISKTISVLKKLGLRNKVKLEASGGINASNISSFAKTGVDMISVGSITNSVSGIDVSLEV